jgi:ABC-type glycerol-3-phosphate transport system substrate-binding protein
MIKQAIRILVLTLMVVPALALVAFGPGSGSSRQDNVVVVEYWEKWTGAEEQQMKQIVDQFNDTIGKDKHIFVRFMSTSNINGKTLVATAGGTPPDIAGIWDWNLVQYASLDALEPLEDMARAAGITSATYKPVYWNACNYKGHLWALISTPAVVALHYNRQAFEQNAAVLRKAGLDPFRPPRTLDELDAYADALTVVDPKGHLVHAGYFPMDPGWYVQYTSFWFGADIYDAKTGQFNLTDPRVVKAFEWLQRYSKKYGKAAVTDFQSGFGNFDSPQNPFLCGQVYMEQQGPWMANYIDHQTPAWQRLLWSRDVEMTKSIAERRKNYGWAAAPFPSAVPGMEDVTYAPFDALAIPRGARHKKEAFEFIAFVNRQDVMEHLCMMHSKNSPLAAVSENYLTHHPNPYIEVFERLANSPNARMAPQTPILAEAVDELTVAAQRVTLLECDAQTALQQAQVRLQDDEDLFVRHQLAREIASQSPASPANNSN